MLSEEASTFNTTSEHQHTGPKVKHSSPRDLACSREAAYHDAPTVSKELLMRRLLTGCFVTLLLLLNTLILIGPLLVFALLKLVAPGRWRDYASGAVMWIAETWAEIDKLIFRLCIPTQWDIRGGEDLRGDTSYLVISNHQSWVDIPALIQTLNRRTPFFKFFLKKELIWVPFLGLAWWALDYPFMKRYTKAFLAKHPELAGKDLEITKQACELFKRQPVTVVNYLEGTRYTAAKSAQQQSPFNHLLKPKAGGVAFVLAAMGEQLDAILDVTVVYPQAEDSGVLGFDQRQRADA